MVSAPMSQALFPPVVWRWLFDAAFREGLRRSPDKVQFVRKANVTLSAEHEELLRNIDWDLSDEEFQDRLVARLRVVRDDNGVPFCPTEWHGTCPCLRRIAAGQVNPPVGED